MPANQPSQPWSQASEDSLAGGSAGGANRAERDPANPAPSTVRGRVPARLVVPPHLILREVAQLVARVLPPTIRTRTEVREGLWPIAGDLAVIHGALINVLLNARAALGENGFLNLSARNVTLAAVPASPIFDARAGDFVMIAISHTGSDIYRSPVHSGVGRFLALVARALCCHGGFGRIGIERRAGLVGTFTLYFPRADCTSAPLDSVAKPVPQTAGSVLIVDDEEEILRLSRLILTRAGYTVLVARGGREALAIMGQKQLDIGMLLTDLRMLDVNGYTLLWALRRIQPGLRVMVATGDHTEENRRELERLGVRQVLAKPFTPRKLMAAVFHTLSAPVPSECEPGLFHVE